MIKTTKMTISNNEQKFSYKKEFKTQDGSIYETKPYDCSFPEEVLEAIYNVRELIYWSADKESQKGGVQAINTIVDLYNKCLETTDFYKE